MSVSREVLASVFGVDVEDVVCQKCRYGDGGELLKALIDDGLGEGPFKTAFFEEVDDTPTIDPVKHGRWLPEGKYACRCSNCGRAINK